MEVQVQKNACYCTVVVYHCIVFKYTRYDLFVGISIWYFVMYLNGNYSMTHIYAVVCTTEQVWLPLNNNIYCR